MSDKGTYRAYGAAKRLQSSTLELIESANRILEEYEAQGFSMTLRQLYYQMVARGLTGGENSKRMYERIGSALNVGRMQGLVSWTAMEDRDRSLRGLRTYRSPGEALREAAQGYRRDLWAGQPWRPEVWIEKVALIDVVAQICNNLRVDFFACKGYNSQSAQWRAGRRFQRYIGKGQRPIIFHLGDHDPSGIDMTRDNRDRLALFAGTPIIVQRLALNMDQIERFNPPPNFAKETDSRTSDYVRQYGEQCWELDALDPRYIHALIKDAVDQVRDDELWNESLAQETADQAHLDLMIEELDGED
jgi:hypothetical protein